MRRATQWPGAGRPPEAPGLVCWPRLHEASYEARAHATKIQPPARTQRAHAAQGASACMPRASRAARTAIRARRARHAPGAASARRTCARTPQAARHATAHAQQVDRGLRREAARRVPAIACSARAPHSTLHARGARANQRLMPEQCRRRCGGCNTRANARRTRRSRLLVDASALRKFTAQSPRAGTKASDGLHSTACRRRRRRKMGCGRESHSRRGPRVERGVRWRCSAGSGKCSGAAGHLRGTPPAQPDATQTQAQARAWTPPESMP